MFNDIIRNARRKGSNPIDLKPNFDLLVSAISSAISTNIPVPLNFKPKDLLQFPTLHQALYKQALEGPYGLVIRQMFDQIFYLLAMQQMLLHITQRIAQLEKIVLEEKIEEAFFEEEYDYSLPLTAEAIQPDDQLKKLKEEQEELSTALPKYQKRVILMNRTYLGAITRFVKEIAAASILNQAERLNYKFNEAERNALLSPVPRAKIHEVLSASYAAHHAEESKEKKPMPEPDYLATRSLHDLELRTLMVINAYRNRILAEMEAALPEATLSDPHKKEEELAKLRAEFHQMHSAPNTHQNASRKYDPKDPRSRFVRQQSQEHIPLNSVMASTRLLKDFKATFQTLDQQAQAFHDLHKNNLSPEEMLKQMNQRIETIKNDVSSAPQSRIKPPTP